MVKKIFQLSSSYYLKSLKMRKKLEILNFSCTFFFFRVQSYYFFSIFASDLYIK